MQCPYCECIDTRVIDSRPGEDGEAVRRRRECQGCSERFTTREQVDFNLPRVIKTDLRREKFSEKKLRGGIARALEKRPVGTDAVEAAIARLQREFTHQGEREISTQVIGEAVMRELRALDEVAYVRFASVYRRFADIAAFSEEVQHLNETRPGQPSKAQSTLLSGRG